MNAIPYRTATTEPSTEQPSTSGPYEEQVRPEPAGHPAVLGLSGSIDLPQA